jgi:hypothetical protein
MDKGVTFSTLKTNKQIPPRICCEKMIKIFGLIRIWNDEKWFFTKSKLFFVCFAKTKEKINKRFFNKVSFDSLKKFSQL